MSALDKIPAWVAFLGLILVGIVMIIIGIFLSRTAQLGFIVIGSGAVVIGVVSWAAGASGKITGRVGTVGLSVAISSLPWWGWLINIVTIVVAIVIVVTAG